MTGPIIMCNTTRNQSVVSSSDNFPVWRRSKDWHISVIALFENQPSEEIYLRMGCVLPFSCLNSCLLLVFPCVAYLSARKDRGGDKGKKKEGYTCVTFQYP